MKTIALIPARSGSKRVRQKNLRTVAGYPLFAWSVAAARSASLVDQVVVSSNDAHTGDLAQAYGAEFIPRPDVLAHDLSPTEDAIRHALDWLGVGSDRTLVVLLQPTSPLRRAEHIDEAIVHMMSGPFDSVASVTRDPGLAMSGVIEGLRYVPSYAHRNRTQELAHIGRENGAIYGFYAETFQKFGNRFGQSVGAYVMEKYDSLDIDDEDDLELANFLMWRELLRRVPRVSVPEYVQ